MERMSSGRGVWERGLRHKVVEGERKNLMRGREPALNAEVKMNRRATLAELRTDSHISLLATWLTCRHWPHDTVVTCGHDGRGVAAVVLPNGQHYRSRRGTIYEATF